MGRPALDGHSSFGPVLRFLVLFPCRPQERPAEISRQSPGIARSRRVTGPRCIILIRQLKIMSSALPGLFDGGLAGC